MRSVVHVTHEAVEKVGGIGAVLEGLITSPAYNAVTEYVDHVGGVRPNGHLGERWAAAALFGVGVEIKERAFGAAVALASEGTVARVWRRVRERV